MEIFDFLNSFHTIGSDDFSLLSEHSKTQLFIIIKKRPDYQVFLFFGSVKDVMLLIYRRLALLSSVGITSPTARNDASARLCEVWNKPKQSLVGSSSSSQHYLCFILQCLEYHLQ
jgi:hypothetical protein